MDHSTEFAYNNKVHTTTQISPFYANYSYNPRMGIEPRRVTKLEPAKEFTEWMKTIHEEAQVALSKVCDDMQTLIKESLPSTKLATKSGWVQKISILTDPLTNLQNDNSDPLKLLRLYHQMLLN